MKRIITNVALFMVFLIVMLPICHAEQLDLSYDGNGNLITGDNKYRIYNSLNQLWKVYNGSDDTGTLLLEYKYHPVEERVWYKTDYENNETVIYVSEKFVKVINLTDDTVKNYTYVYHNGQKVAQKTDEVYFIHSDHLGSASVVSNSTAGEVERTNYDAAGNILQGGDKTLFDYEDREFNSVLGSYDFRFRHYNPETMLFEQPDSIIPNKYDPQQLNRYMFERGNSLKYTDETGHVIDGGTLALGLAFVALIIFSETIQVVMDERSKSNDHLPEYYWEAEQIKKEIEEKEEENCFLNLNELKKESVYDENGNLIGSFYTTSRDQTNIKSDKNSNNIKSDALIMYDYYQKSNDDNKDDDNDIIEKVLNTY